MSLPCGSPPLCTVCMAGWFAGRGDPARFTKPQADSKALSVAGRNRYVDLLRVVAIGGVVYGHWLLINLTYSDGRLANLDTLAYVPWGQWITWAFQVMPVFFLAGGYANAGSWTAHHADGERWNWWIQRRAMRLWWPTGAYLGVNALVIAALNVAGVARANIALVGLLVTRQLWFLPVYLVMIALTPAMLAAHRRWGLAVPAGLAVAAALVSAAAAMPHLAVVGYVNYLLVWGAMHQLGFAWRDGLLTRTRWQPYVLATVGAVVLAALVTSGAYPPDMIGPRNTNPPSIALLAYAAGQAGLVLAAEPGATRLLARSLRWHWVQRLNDAVMTVYLWHFAPVLLVAAAFYPTGAMPQPAIGSAHWWELRPAWLGLLTVVLVPMIIVIMWTERPMLRLPAGTGPAGAWSPALLLVGLAASLSGLSELTMAGFAPGGQLPWTALAECAVGLVATVLSGRDPVPAPSDHESAASGGRPAKAA